MSISWPTFLFLVLAVTSNLPAQQACPPETFQIAASANLVPSASSYQVLLRQDDGSYTAYEITNTPPYRALSTYPNFQRQLRTCPMAPMTPLPNQNGPQGLFTHLPSGQYLFIDSSYSTTGCPPDPYCTNLTTVNATVFDRNMNQVSRSQDLLASLQPYLYEGVSPLLVADLNHDGNPEGVFEHCVLQHGFVYGSCSVAVMLGTGGGGLQQPVSYAISTSVHMTALAAADINGDGKLDLIVASTPDQFLNPYSSPGKVSVLLGNGDGSFQSERIALSGPYVAGLAVADLNHDGKPDLAFSTVSQNAGGISVAVGAGDGTFSNPANYPTAFGSQIGPIRVAIGDLDGDGNPDIVVAGLSILFGDGKGAFPRRRDYLAPSQGSLVLTDFDGDGKTDIVIAAGDPQVLYASSNGPSITVLFGKGNGEFVAPQLSLIPGSTDSNNIPLTVASADFDGDGFPDLVVSQLLRISVLKGMGDGTFTTTKQYANVDGVGFTTQFAIGDFNRDGKPDYAAVAGGPNAALVQTFLGNGDGTFQRPPGTAVPLWANALAAGDFNEDGIPDLAVVGAPYLDASANSLQILLGKGDGTFRQGTQYAAGPGVNAVIAADFNGDGKLDLAIANTGALDPATHKVTNGNVTIQLGKGDGTFSTAAILPLKPAYGPDSLVAADFNRDGKIDLVVSQTDNMAMLLGHGDGTFGPAAVLMATQGAASIMAVDLNGDNMLDLVIWPGDSVAMSGFLIGNGDGTFQPEVSVDFGAALAAVDFNHDGKLDFATVTGSGVATLLNVSGTQAPLIVVSAASFQQGAVAPESLTAAFGANLASASEGTGALPMILAGTGVSIQDSSGVVRGAPLLYVSPQQVNFLVPSGTSTGIANVTVWNGAVPHSTRQLIAAVAPSLFTLNASGLAAAYAVRVSADGQQMVEPVFTLRNGGAVAAPVDVGTPTEQVYLILYGTGIRGAGTAATSATIQGLSAQVTYAGLQADFAGLDQVNVLLPKALAGSGDVTIVLTAAGVNANPVHFSVK